MQDETINRLLTAFGIFMLIQNILIFAYMAFIQSTTEKYYTLRENMERNKQYYAGVMTAQQAVRKLAHDIRSHFAFLMSALNKSDVRGAKMYLQELDGNLTDMSHVNMTGHYDIDSLLYVKSRAAGDQGVRLLVEGKLPPNLTISPVDLSKLLGNALENAIEAAQEVEGAVIRARFACNHNRLSFIIENPFKGERKQLPDGKFLSTREGGGLGSSIMDQVVKKYDGALVRECTDSHFSVTVMFRDAVATDS